MLWATRVVMLRVCLKSCIIFCSIIMVSASLISSWSRASSSSGVVTFSEIAPARFSPIKDGMVTVVLRTHNPLWESLKDKKSSPGDSVSSEAVSWFSSDMVVFSKENDGPVGLSLAISSLSDKFKGGESSSWCRRFSGLGWGLKIPSMASLVRSSAAGDAKLKLIEAALTDVSA